MNKSGLIDAVSKTTSLAKREAEEAVNALVHVVSHEVRSGRRVVVAGFGSFNPTRRAARMGRNPQTGAPVSIGPARGVRFAASAMLKDVLNGKASLPAPKASSSSSTGIKKASSPRAATKKAGVKKTAARTAAKKAPTRATTRVSTRKAAPVAARRATKKVVGRAPAKKVAKRAPARKATRPSARKAAGRPPARNAAKRPAKKAVRRA